MASPYPERIVARLERDARDTVVATDRPITVDWLHRHSIDFVVSYGYRHILGDDVIGAYGASLINLHISMLPWNRGSDPNFWSWFDATPKGVTIHVIDRGIDTGSVLAQRSVPFGEDETLETSYQRLRVEIESLFEEAWPAIRTGELRPRPQSGPGSYHRQREKAVFMERLPEGWRTPVRAVAALGRAFRAGRLDAATASR